jgi:hypothetical protein
MKPQCKSTFRAPNTSVGGSIQHAGAGELPQNKIHRHDVVTVNRI